MFLCAINIKLFSVSRAPGKRQIKPSAAIFDGEAGVLDDDEDDEDFQGFVKNLTFVGIWSRWIFLASGENSTNEYGSSSEEGQDGSSNENGSDVDDEEDPDIEDEGERLEKIIVLTEEVCFLNNC